MQYKKPKRYPKYCTVIREVSMTHKEYTGLAKSYEVTISMSKKASPWENGFQESFYSGFKLDLGEPNRFNNLGELVEAIYQTIHYYNNSRIHTKLKSSPHQFYVNYQNKINLVNTLELVS